MAVKVNGRKLRKGSSMSVTSADIYPKLQRLINRGYLVLSQEKTVNNDIVGVDPEENLPATDPAPEVPAPIKEELVQEVVEEKPVLVEKKVEKPKITRRRKKKASPKSEE